MYSDAAADLLFSRLSFLLHLFNDADETLLASLKGIHRKHTTRDIVQN